MNRIRQIYDRIYKKFGFKVIIPSIYIIGVIISAALIKFFPDFTYNCGFCLFNHYGEIAISILSLPGYFSIAIPIEFLEDFFPTISDRLFDSLSSGGDSSFWGYIILMMVMSLVIYFIMGYLMDLKYSKRKPNP